MIYRFRPRTLSHPSPVHRDRNYLFRPLIPLSVIGPKSSIPFQVILDSGSACELFPRQWIRPLGIRQFVGTGSVHGIGSDRPNPPMVQYAEVLLRLGQGEEVCQWKAVVGFTDAPMSSEGLFGIAGGLEYFHTTLDVFSNQIVMIPRVTLPVAVSL